MSTALALPNSGFPTPLEFTAMKDMAIYAVASGLLPASVNTKEKALIIVMKSRALGIDPMHGLWSISVINNKPCMSAELMLAVGLKNVPGFKYDFIKTDNNECVIEASRPGGKPTRFSFTLEDAKRAGIYKNVWLTYPAAMLRARATSAMARAMIPDALAGVVYTPEEMGAQVDQNGEVVRDVTPPEDPPPGKQPTPKQQTVQAQQATAKIEEIRKEFDAERSTSQMNSYGQVVFCGGKWDARSFDDIVNDPDLGWIELQNYMHFLSKPTTAKKEWISHILNAWPHFKAEYENNHKVASDSRLDAIADKLTQDDFDNGFAKVGDK